MLIAGYIALGFATGSVGVLCGWGLGFLLLPRGEIHW